MAMSEQAARDIVDLVSSTDDHFDSEFDDEGASESEDEIRTACERLPEPARVAISRKRSFQRSGKESVAKRGRIAGGSSTSWQRPPSRAAISRGIFDRVQWEDLLQRLQPDSSTEEQHCEITHFEPNHKTAKERKSRAQLHQQALIASWEKYTTDHKKELAGTGLSGDVANDVLIRRANVVESFLKAGVPLSKIDHLRLLLESNYCRMTYSTHMAHLVPLLLQNEQSTIKKEIAAHLTVIVDGTSRLGEALAVVLRYVDGDFNIHQRLVRFSVLSKSLAGTELARELITVLSTQLQASSHTVLALVPDCAAVNGVAVRVETDLFDPIYRGIKLLADNARRKPTEFGNFQVWPWMFSIIYQICTKHKSTKL